MASIIYKWSIDEWHELVDSAKYLNRGGQRNYL